MKLTFLISSVSNGGAEAVCINVINLLCDVGYDVDLVVLYEGENSYRHELSNKANFIDLGVHRARHSFRALLNYFKSSRPDMVFIFKFELLFFVIGSRFILRQKFPIIARNITMLSRKNKSISLFDASRTTGLIFKYFPGQVSCVINQSESMKKDFLKNFPLMTSRTVVINNAVKANISNYISKYDPIPLSHRENYVLCVGRLEKVKGYHHALKALFIFNKMHNKSIRIKFLGDGSQRLALEKYAIELGIRDLVDFVGFKGDLIDYYRFAICTVFTSEYEGYPNSMIESLCLGTPVVSFDCPSGPREILAKGKFGILVPQEDVTALANAISDIYFVKKSFCLNERRKHFSPERMRDAYLELIQNLSYRER